MTLTRRTTGWILVGILMLGLGLRLRGLRWGLPGQSRYYHGITYSPDEQSTFYAIRQLSWSKRQFYPTEMNVLLKGTLQTYTVAVALGIASPWLRLSSDPRFYQGHPEALDALYLVGRWVSLLQSLTAVLALFWLGSLVFGRPIGLGGALLLAIAPVHVVNAHFISTDSAFCLYLILLGVACHFIATRGWLRDYVAAGVLCGLLAANKYSAGTAGIMVVVGHFMGSPRPLSRCLYAAAAGVIALCIGCPAIVLGWTDFLAAVRHSIAINLQLSSPLGDAFYPRSALLFYFVEGPLFGLGLPLWVLCLAGWIYAIRRRNAATWVWSAWLVVFIWSLTSASWRLVRWTMPLHPFLFLFAAALGYRWWQRQKAVASVAGIALLLFTGLQSWTYVTGMTTPDTRDVASDWIMAHVPAQARIGTGTPPFAWDPPLLQQIHEHPETLPAEVQVRHYRVVVLHEDLEILDRENPDYIVLTDYTSFLYARHPERYRGQPYARYFDAVFSSGRYELVETLTKRVTLGSWDWYGASRSYPHDWRYPFPNVYLFIRSDLAPSEKFS